MRENRRTKLKKKILKNCVIHKQHAYNYQTDITPTIPPPKKESELSQANLYR